MVQMVYEKESTERKERDGASQTAEVDKSQCERGIVG